MIRRQSARRAKPRYSPRPRRAGPYARPYGLWPFHYNHGQGVQTIKDISGSHRHITTNNATSNFWEHHPEAGGWTVDPGSSATMAPLEAAPVDTITPPLTVMVVAQRSAGSKIVVSHRTGTTNHGWLLQFHSGGTLRYTFGGVGSLISANLNTEIPTDDWFVAVFGTHEDDVANASFLGARSLSTKGAVPYWTVGNPGAMSGSPTQLWIGCSGSDSADFWANQVSCVAIWRRGLREHDARQLLYNPWLVFEPATARLPLGDVSAATAYSLAIDASSYAWTPQNVGLAYGRVAGMGAASYAWTPQTVGLAYGRVVGVDAASYSWTPQTVGLAFGRALGVDAAAYTWTAQAVGLAYGRVLSAEAASYTWSPQDVTLAWSGAAGATIAIDAASYAWTPQAVGLAFGRVVGIGAATYTWTPQALTGRHNKLASIEAASYSWAPQALTGLVHNKVAAIDAATYSWTPQAVGAAYGRVLTAGAISYTWAAQDLTLTWSAADFVVRTFSVGLTPRRFTVIATPRRFTERG